MVNPSSLELSIISPALSSQDNFDSIQNRQRKAIADLSWENQYLKQTFREWIQKAKTMDVDVEKQINKKKIAFQDKPTIQTEYQLVVWLLYKTKMLNIFSCQIIRKIAKERIKRSMASLRVMSGLQHQIGLINRSEQFLLKYLPAKLPSIVPSEIAAQQYWSIKVELNKAMQAILCKAKIVRPRSAVGQEN